MAENNQFKKSDIGARAAWKGFSSQTLYIVSRIVADTDDNCFYPEDIEDLVIKNEDKVVEAVQIKYVSADLTVSHLSSSKASLSGEGFFNRVCSLHAQYPEFNIVKVVYFTSLGDELNGISRANKSYCKSVKEKLVKNHKLTTNDAEWLVSSLVFEKADISTLEQTIYRQVKEYVETMAAPEIAKSLLIQHVSELSKSKGFINKKTWKEQIHSIGVDITSIDGYFKEYNKCNKTMSFALSTYLNSNFNYVIFSSVVVIGEAIRETILKDITAKDYTTTAFTLKCAEETLIERHKKRGDTNEVLFQW